MARTKVDESNSELRKILEELLEENVEITGREVVSRHSSLANASAISRNEERRKLLEEFQSEQRKRRTWSGRLRKESREKTAADLAQRDARIAQLQAQVTALTQSHRAMMTVVGELGGMAKLTKFYERYRETRGQLASLDLLPSASVTALPQSAGKAKKP